MAAERYHNTSPAFHPAHTTSPIVRKQLILAILLLGTWLAVLLFGAAGVLAVLALALVGCALWAQRH